ncbi:hypothetical protein TYRP_004779 [Tyrophagus putrescentiae]|nr:hypothetical protein TYRP_004779 [Tyrophagus putrescentiae]
MFSAFVFLSALALASANSYGGGDYGGHSVDAAVKSSHSVSTYPVESHQQTAHPVVDINSGPLPLTVRFNSHSSQLNLIQKHFGSPGQVQKQSSVDEPDIREVISPVRTRTQEIRPIETIIASGHGGSGGGGYGGHKSSYGGHKSSYGHGSQEGY